MAGKNLGTRLQVRSINPNLLGSTTSDYSAIVELFAPLLADAGELISLGDQYTVSVGAHSPHAILLMAKANASPRLTIEKALNHCALLTYVTDSPIVPQPLDNLRQPPPHLPNHMLNLQGTSLTSLDAYLESVVCAADIAQRFLDADSDIPGEFWSQREFPTGAWAKQKWMYVDIPSDPNIWRALSAYSSGLLSVLAPGRILNFWRAVEAVTTIAQRNSMFTTLPKLRTRPVWSRRFPSDTRRHFARFNAVSRLRKRAIQHWQDLIALHGSAQYALQHLHNEKRGKAAHADRYALEYDGLPSLAEQIRDGELLRYFARVVIDQAW